MIDQFNNAPHCRDAYIYAYDIVTGKIPASIEIVQACQRFIDDLGRDFGFHFDAGKGENACRFVEKLPHTKGRWASKGLDITLEPFQKFIIANIFGWVDGDGLRRFREVYIKEPRKNGKSLLSAAIGHLMFTKDGEFGAEVYSGATTEKQAWEVFGPARLMAKRTEQYTDFYGIDVNAKSLVIIDNGSKFEPLIGNPGDGASPSCAIVDEYHEHKTDDFVSTMKTGMGSREQPLMLIITTAGADMGGPCFEMESEYRKLLQGVYKDDRTFVLIYGIDEDDDWTDPAILIKANPNYGISVSEEFLLSAQAEAIRNASKQNAFKRKHLNVWVGAKTAWLNMERVKKCVDATLKVQDYQTRDCVIPVDLASKIDITAVLKLFTEMIGGKVHYTAFCRFYIPEETAQDPKNGHYQKWITDGWLIATDGNEIDFNEIQMDIINDMNEFRVKEITYDPWRATQLAQGLKTDGATITEFRNTVQNMSPAMYELEAAIESGRFHYDGNPVLTWMLSNVVSKIDAKDNIFPRKEKPENKIDGVISLIMGVGRSMVHEEAEIMPGFAVI